MAKNYFNRYIWLIDLIQRSGHISFKDIPSSQRWLSDIMAAMREGKKLELTHQGYWRDAPHTFTMAPYCVKLFKQRWYLTGLSDGYTELRTYALDRIHAVKTTNISFKLPKGFDAREYFRKFFGIVTDNREAETVELRVDANQAKYFRSLPLHPTQEERELEDGYFMFTYRLVPTFDFTRELLSKGELIEVVSPHWLRKEIANELRNTLSMYDDIENCSRG